MANYRAVASGNWSAGATWGGGAVPPNAAGHSIYSNTFTVTVDTNVDVALVTNAGNAGTFVGGGTAAAGGGFTLSNGVTLTSNVTLGTNATLVTLSSTNSASIVGNITGSNNSSISCVLNSGTGTLTITGNITGGTATTSNFGCNNSGNGTTNVTGSIVGGSGGTGNFALTNSGIGSVTMTGSVTGGSTSAGANNSSTGTFTVIGDITGTSGSNGFTSANINSVNRLSGSFISAANGVSAIYAIKYFLNTSPTSAKTRYSLNGSSTYLDMFTADNSLGQASTSDVRFGTVYASGALTGVAYIPSASSVAFGVPVDNTTGTAALTPASVWDHLLSAITSSSTIGTLLKTNIDATISSRSTLTSANVRTELTPELTEITEVHAIHGLDIANALTVTPTSRTSGAITQSISGDGTTNTVVTRV